MSKKAQKMAQNKKQPEKKLDDDECITLQDPRKKILLIGSAGSGKSSCLQSLGIEFKSNSISESDDDGTTDFFGYAYDQGVLFDTMGCNANTYDDLCRMVSEATNVCGILIFMPHTQIRKSENSWLNSMKRYMKSCCKLPLRFIYVITKSHPQDKLPNVDGERVLFDYTRNINEIRDKILDMFSLNGSDFVDASSLYAKIMDCEKEISTMKQRVLDLEKIEASLIKCKNDLEVEVKTKDGVISLQSAEIDKMKYDINEKNRTIGAITKENTELGVDKANAQIFKSLLGQIKNSSGSLQQALENPARYCTGGVKDTEIARFRQLQAQISQILSNV